MVGNADSGIFCNYIVDFKKQPFKVQGPTSASPVAPASGGATSSASSSSNSASREDYALREWIWLHHKESILAAMDIRVVRMSSTSSSCEEKDDSEDCNSDAILVSKRSPLDEVLLASLPPSHSSSSSPESFHSDGNDEDSTKAQHENYRNEYNELMKTTEKLQEANQQLMRASKLQLQHFASIIHEIRTPLNAVLGLSNVLQAESTGSLNQMQHESLNMIISSGDLLLTVVNDVLDYAKLETGNVDIEIQRSNLQETLNSIVHSIQTKADDNNVKFRTYYDATIPEYIRTDSRRLQQILFNLLGNAIKFSHKETLKEDGDEHEARHQPAVELHVKLVTSSNRETSTKDKKQDGASIVSKMSESNHQRLTDNEMVLRFIVRDNGKGIDEKDMERIFQPFRQAGIGNETERLYGGTGLGLAITSKLVHGLDGAISVKSQVGEWSEFTVDLPFRSSRSRQDSALDQEPVNIVDLSCSFPPNATILLVHDDIEYRQQVQDMFQQYNIDCVHFTSMHEMEGAPTMATDGKDDTRIKQVPFVLSNSRQYVCLVYEDLYDKESYGKLLSGVKSILLTFGPKYSVPETRGHYRSLVQVLPSVLMTSISETLIEVFAPSPGSKAKVKRPSRGGGLVRAISHSSANSTNSIPYNEFRVLVAEDNIINQKVLLRMLKRLGFKHVDVVDNGQLAVDKEASQTYDVVLMDMQMPIMDGIDACRIIANRKPNDEAGTTHPPAKVVFVTANVSNTIQDECIRAGGTGFLPKPINLHGIEECFQKLQLQPSQQ